MPVSAHDVQRVAELANLQLTPGEATAMLRDLNSVMDYFAELNELDTTGIPPMTGGQIAEADSKTPGQQLRDDAVAPSLNRDRVLTAAPDSDGIFFKVPKVIER